MFDISELSRPKFPDIQLTDNASHGAALADKSGRAHQEADRHGL
jgi:hypothetical protein